MNQMKNVPLPIPVKDEKICSIKRRESGEKVPEPLKPPKLLKLHEPNKVKQIATVSHKHDLEDNISLIKEIYTNGGDIDMKKSCKCFKDIFNQFESTHKSLIKDSQCIPSQGLILNNINEFFNVYDKNIKPLILKHFQDNLKILEDKRLALNCWCVSMNIIGLYYNAEVQIVLDDSDLRKRIFHYLVEFKEYLEANAVAKRIVEVSLYCLCNYFNRRSDGSYTLDKETKLAILHYGFRTSKESDEIRLASGIILAFTTCSDNSDARELLKYINDIYDANINESRSEFLGIQGDLLKKAIICLSGRLGSMKSDL